MDLILGKHHLIRAYVIGVLNKAVNSPLCCPSETTHFTELDMWVEQIRREKPAFITTQRQDMIDALLASDLEFSVITVRVVDDNKIVGTKLSKDEAKRYRQDYNMELRI